MAVKAEEEAAMAVVMANDVLIELLWQQARPTLYISRDDFVRSLDGWTIDPQNNDDGELAVVWLTKGPQLHFTTFGPRWKLTREDIRHRLEPLIDQYGHAETFTPIEDTRQHRFNKLLGFVATKEDASYIHYKIERLRHA
jgi:hypothetical protein